MHYEVSAVPGLGSTPINGHAADSNRRMGRGYSPLIIDRVGFSLQVASGM